MGQKNHYRSASAAVALMMVGLLLLWPGVSAAQTVVGDAAGVRATVLAATSLLGSLNPTPTTLADTGTLAGINDERDAGQLTGSVPFLLSGEVLNAATISWPDQVDSESSLAALNLTVAGIGISADSVMAQASQVLGAAGSGSSIINNLSINGVPIVVTGDPNQTILMPGGQVVINEQTISPTGTAVVNALHVTVSGVADVVVSSATAGIS